MTVVFSRTDIEHYTPPGSLRTYDLAPLTYREAQAFRGDMMREAGPYPSNAQMMTAMRAAVRELAPGNMLDLLAAIDQAEAEPGNMEARGTLAVIESVCTDVPAYRLLLAQRQRHLGHIPWFAARYCLRGWEGPGLPEFARVKGLVPEALLDAIPDDELEAVGWHANNMMRPAPAVSRFSEAPSPSPESPAPSTEG